MNFSAIFCVFLSFFGMIACEHVINGRPCGDPPVVQNFNLQQFEGLWYEIEDYHEDLSQVVKNQCNEVNYAIVNSSTINITTSYVTETSGGKVEKTQQGTIDDERQPAKWTIFLVTNIPGHDESEHLYLNYDILDTDYTNYALVWACSGTSSHHHVDAYILSRSNTLSAETLGTIHSNLGKYNLTENYFHPTNHENC